jgi:coenzyme PQQ precursor peptide PqqA
MWKGRERRGIDVAPPACAIRAVDVALRSRGVRAVNLEMSKMAWKAPKIVEVPVGMEINMYACAARK